MVSRHAGVVGKPDRPTPILNSAIHELNFNAVWHLPPTVIEKDLIPKGQEMARRGQSVLTKYHIDTYGADGKKLDPENPGKEVEDAGRAAAEGSAASSGIVPSGDGVPYPSLFLATPLNEIADGGEHREVDQQHAGDRQDPFRIRRFVATHARHRQHHETPLPFGTCPGRSSLRPTVGVPT